jgi:uncharacterized protein YecE (DUF72 family)
MEDKKIHIGTSGWSYKHWKNIFYPAGVKATDYLSYYAQHFNIAEINTSFYHLPKEQTVKDWAAKVPPQFKFCAKMSRYLTHMKKLHNPEEPLERFFSVFSFMQAVMGPVLIQLPPILKFNYTVTEHFYQVLNNLYNQYEFVLEVRHPTWLRTDSLTLMAKYNIGLVIAQSGHNFPYAETITAKNIYIRFHGPNELYASSYTNEMLCHFAAKFKEWRSNGHVIWAFFNNDIHGYAISNAKSLIQLS